MAKGTTNTGRVAENRKARHEYEIEGKDRSWFDPAR